MDINASSDTFTIYENGWITKIKRPADKIKPEKILLMLHGWTGDENSMWVFTSGLPEEYWLIALRAPLKTSFGGYEWIKTVPGQWPKLSEFKNSVDGVFNHLNYLKRYFSIPTPKVDLIGFSQGGSMTYAFAFLYPQLVQKAAVLSGFLPKVDLPINQNKIARIKFLITHGKQDKIIPIEKAREAVNRLNQLEVSPKYCEEESEHKISTSCYKTVQQFFAQIE